MASIAEHGTPRLALSRLGPAGFAELARMHSDPRVMATLGGLRDEAWTRTTLANSAAHWDRHGFGYWLLFERASGRFAGRGGLRHVEIDGRDEVELGYALMA